MPVTTIRNTGFTTNEDGESNSLNPDEALCLRGPCIEATLTVSDAQQEALTELREVARSEVGLVMFDTGASISCFDQQAATRVGLAIVGRGNMTSASHVSHPVPIYAGKLNLPRFNVNIENGMGANLAPQRLLALIGRDILRMGTLFYNGTDGSVCFAI